jgi:hypothetical protein
MIDINFSPSQNVDYAFRIVCEAVTYRGTCHLALPDGAQSASLNTAMTCPKITSAIRSEPESAKNNRAKIFDSGLHNPLGIEKAGTPAFQSSFDSPHRTICRRSFCHMVSLSHFLTAPDETSCSERAVVNVATRA